MKKVMRRREFKVVCLIGILLLFCATAQAQILDINLDWILGYGMNSSFDATARTQTLIGLNGAIVHSDEDDYWYFSTGSSDISAIFTGAVGNTSGTEAEAHYDGGTWSITLYDAGSPVLDLSGTVVWYWEIEDEEIAVNRVGGQGLVTVDPILPGDIDDTFFGGHGEWSSADGKSAIITTISGATPPPLDNYDSDWSSTNVSMTLWADSSKAVPEPATMMLFGLGSLLFLRKRK